MRLVVTPEPIPASYDEVRAMFSNVDASIVVRIVETHATVDEIGEALHTLDDDGTPDEPSSSSRVAAVRAILAELVGDECAECGATSISV